MVEFVRDVVIVVAILVTLVAVALNLTTDTGAARRGEQRSAREINVTEVGPKSAEAIVIPDPTSPAVTR